MLDFLVRIRLDLHPSNIEIITKIPIFRFNGFSTCTLFIYRAPIT